MSPLVTPLQSALRAGIERRARLRLARELADFATRTDQAELEAMIERLAPAQAREIRDTLALVA